MRISSLHDLYIEHLRGLFEAEQQLIKALQQAAAAASSQELKDALDEHCDQGHAHLRRLKEVFERLAVHPKGKKSAGICGLIAEIKEWIDADIEPEVLDAALILCIQRIEHFEIASYGCACAFARLMGREEEAELLEEILDEEKEADEILTDVADNNVNGAAHDDEENGEDEDEEEDEEETKKALEKEEDEDDEEEEESPRNADRD